MSEFLGFAWELLAKVVYNVVAVVSSILNLLVFGWVEYFSIFMTYFTTFDLVGKIGAVILFAMLIAVPVLIVAILVHRYRINRRLHRRRRVASRRKHGIQPTGHRRSELPRLVDHLCDTVRITSAFHPVQDNRPDCNLSLVRLVSRFTENDGRKQRLFLRRKRHFLLLGCRTLPCDLFLSCPNRFFLDLSRTKLYCFFRMQRIRQMIHGNRRLFCLCLFHSEINRFR